MFRYLSRKDGIITKVYYYDYGSLGKMYDPGYGNSEAWDVDLLGGTQSVILRNPFRGKQISGFRQFNPGVITAILRERFDVILLMGYVSPSNWLVLMLAKLLAIPVLYQSDTNILDEERKQSSWLKKTLRNFFLNRVNRFLVIGDKNQAAYLSFGLAEKRMQWCPYPLDIAYFKQVRSDPELQLKLGALRKQYSIPADAQVVIFCGKLIERKRPRDVIEALRFLQRNNLYALLIGSGELENELRQNLTPADNVRITGFVNQSAIPYHMLLGNVAVVTSEWDPHPLVTTEFAACGLPIVISNFCGVWGEHDILRPEVNGLVYPCGNVRLLAETLTKVLDDTAMMRQMSFASLELAETQSAEHAANIIANLAVSLKGHEQQC
jgi:glycosyltransferase involved in cell wall biosynthesis